MELMRSLSFGRICDLHVRDGEPVFSPPPRYTKVVKLGQEAHLDRDFPARDYTLKKQVVDLFRHFDADRDLDIAILEVKNGLPFKFEVEGTMQET